MKARLLAGLLVANSLLFAGSAVFYFQARLARVENGTSSANHRPRAKPTFQSSRPSVATNRAHQVAPQVVYRTNEFHWRQVESNDYRTYIANLRKIGCPEDTIRDLVMTDIMRHYALRRGKLYHRDRPFRFWETDEKRSLTARQASERDQLLAGIDREVPMVLRELLGINYERELNKYFVDTREEERRLSFLPEDARLQLQKWQAEFETRKGQLLDLVMLGHLTPEEQQKRFEALEQEEEKLIKESLTPEQRHELELRTSPLSEQLRSALVGFEPSEEEFRNLYEIYQQHAGPRKNLTDKNLIAELSSNPELRKAVEQKLGDTRAAQFQLVHSNGFSDAARFAARHELPSSAARELFDIRNIVESERNKLLVSDQFSAQQKEEILRLLRQETERSIADLVGEKVARNYLTEQGTWLQQASLLPQSAQTAPNNSQD